MTKGSELNLLLTKLVTSEITLYEWSKEKPQKHAWKKITFNLSGTKTISNMAW